MTLNVYEKYESFSKSPWTAEKHAEDKDPIGVN